MGIWDIYGWESPTSMAMYPLVEHLVAGTTHPIPLIFLTPPLDGSKYVEIPSIHHGFV
jgi:hypothetical protein